MIRPWFRALVKYVLSGKVLQHAARQARRGSVRPHLEALEDRLATSITELGVPWPSIPVAVAASAVFIASHDDPMPLPGRTAPAGGSELGQGTPGWEGLLRHVLEVGPPNPATAQSPPTTPTPSASGSVITSAPAPFADESFSAARPSPPAAEGMVQRTADLSFALPPSAGRAEDGAAQRPLPGPAARTGAVQPDRSDGVSTVPVARHDRPPTPLPQSSERQSVLADSPAVTRLVVDDRAVSIPAKADPEQLPARVPDYALLRRYVAKGDQAAFRTLVRRHERVVFGTCQRVLGDSHMAQEAFQTTFMVLARKAAVLDARQPLTAWLCKVAFRAALRLRAAVANRRRRERAAARPSPVVAPLSADLERKEIFQALAEELQRLPEKYRAPLVLCYLDGRTHGEAAHMIGLPRGSMAKRIRQGLLRLRVRLVTRGFMV